MKKFNLKEYLANPSKKIVTREGKPVRIICTDVKGISYSVLALVDKGDYEVPTLYTKKGEYNLETTEYSYDLFFAPEKHEGWANVYKSGFGWSLGTSIWQTKEEAKKWVGAADYATTIKIEWEE